MSNMNGCNNNHKETKKTGHAITVCAGEGRYRLWAAAVATHGEGINITIGGGEIPHIGAVAVAVPRPSLKDPSQVSTTTSVYVLMGHKDEALAKPIAERIARAMQQPVVVAAGVHLGKEGSYTASAEEIEKVLQASTILVEELIRRLVDED